MGCQRTATASGPAGPAARGARAARLACCRVHQPAHSQCVRPIKGRRLGFGDPNRPLCRAAAAVGRTRGRSMSGVFAQRRSRRIQTVHPKIRQDNYIIY